MQGWIKLHRALQDWEWKNSPKHVAVFVDILINVNHKDASYRGVKIPAGSMTTSYGAMSNRTGVSIRGIRTVLKDLKSTHEVTQTTTSKYSMISVTNWDKYQSVDTVDDKQTTSKRQANDKQTTTNKNEKNEKNEKNIQSGNPTICEEVINYLNKKTNKNFRHTTKKTQSFINARIKEGYSLQDFKKVIDVKTTQWLYSEEFNRYLRPDTLFSNKFEGYLNDNEVKSPEKRRQDLIIELAEMATEE